MKKLISAFILLFGILLNAQKIDIKKNKILVNDKEVALTDKDKKIVTLSTLDGSAKFTFKKEILRLDNKSDILTYEVTNPTTGNANTLVIHNPMLGLNDEKVLVNNLLKKTIYFTDEGLNVPNLNSLLTSPKVEVKEIIKEKNDSIAARYKVALNRFNEDQLQINNWKIIDKTKPSNDNIVAYLSLTKVGAFEYIIEVYKITDEKKPVKVGIWSNGAEVINFEEKRQLLQNELITINGDEILIIPDEFKAMDAKSISESEPGKRITVFMHEFGYF